MRHLRVRSSRVAFEGCDAFHGQRGIPTDAGPYTDARCVVPIETEIEKRISEGASEVPDAALDRACMAVMKSNNLESGAVTRRRDVRWNALRLDNRFVKKPFSTRSPCGTSPM